MIAYFFWIKALHVIAIICWMAGMLYLPRLYVNHCTVQSGGEASELLKSMERRLMRYIMHPAMIVVWLSGFALIWSLFGDGSFSGAYWVQVKLLCVVLMTFAHGFLFLCRLDFAHDRNRFSARFFRIINEVPTILMIVIVIMVVVKPF